jgi:hypothetical protein
VDGVEQLVEQHARKCSYLLVVEVVAGFFLTGFVVEVVEEVAGFCLVGFVVEVVAGFLAGRRSPVERVPPGFGAPVVLGAGLVVVVVDDVEPEEAGASSATGASSRARAGAPPGDVGGTGGATVGGAGGGMRSRRRAYCMIREKTGAATWPP